MRTLLVLAALLTGMATYGEGVITQATATHTPPCDSVPVIHYWDNYDFSKTASDSSATLEEEFIRFINLTSTSSRTQEAFSQLLVHIGSNNELLNRFIDLAQQLLADSHSPVYNEELYITMLESIAASEQITAIKRDQINYHLALALKNRIGTTATDFEMLLRDGSYSTLHTVTGNKYILLYMGDPECNVCHDAMQQLLASQHITQLTESGDLTIISLSIEGNTTSWQNASAPAGWIDACDENCIIFDEELYDITSIPSFYLLDNNHKVILRDVHIGYIINFLTQR